ncbi:MAG: hypothetical protein WC821_02835 [archaeon]|jgi:uncharacterized protein (UPF0333 family)
MQKGQAAIEFIFIILIVVVYIVTVTMPLVKEGQNALSDVENISRINNETQKIANTISDLSTQGINSKQTLIVFLPEQSKIDCNTTGLNYDLNLKQQPYPAQCPIGICSKDFNTPSNLTLACGVETIKGPSKLKIIVEKIATNTIRINRGS